MKTGIIAIILGAVALIIIILVMGYNNLNFLTRLGIVACLLCYFGVGFIIGKKQSK